MVKQDKNFTLFPFRATPYIDSIISEFNQNTVCALLY